MKRSLCLILICCLLFSGCGFFGERIREPVTFHYICNNYQEELCCVIVSEQREASGHTADLPYLLTLYSMGPVSDELVSPLRPGTKIAYGSEEGQLVLDLITPGSFMTDIEFSLACACLTLTFQDLTGSEHMIIRCGDRSKTLSKSSLTFYDSTADISPTEEPQ